MRPENAADWIAFVLLVIGAIAWGFFVFDVNVLDYLLEMIWDPLDNIVFAIIAIAGIYAIIRVFVARSSPSRLDNTDSGGD